MSTLGDLRNTLNRHADDLDDTERYIRPVAVHARVRTVRRRRVGLVAVAAAVVLLAGIATVNAVRTPGTIQPADRVVVGVDVPGTIAVQDFPYDLDRLDDLTHEPVHVDPADHDQAVLLAASGLDGGSATLYSQGDPVARVRGDEQLSAPVPLGEAGVDLEVRFDGAGPDARAGVAGYEATGELAPGVDNGTAVFRNEVAGAQLLGAVFSSPGDTSVSLDVRSTGNRLRTVFYCTASDDLWVNVSVDGHGGLASSCNDTRGGDVGVGTSGTTPYPAGEHDVRVYLTDGSSGPEVAAPDGAEFGVGVYAPPPPGPKVMGIRVESHVEYAGRDWVLDRTVAPPATIGTADGDVLLGLVGRGHRVGATWTGRLTHGQPATADSPEDATTTLGGVLLAGDRYTVTVDGGVATLLVYRPE